MFRALHRWAGILAALLLTIVSLTGFILSLFPLLTTDRTSTRLDAGALVAAVQDTLPGVQQISVDLNGVVTAMSFGDGGLTQVVIDPATGDSLGPVTTSALELWFENLHRSLFLSDAGQMTVLIASVAMILLTLSGLSLAARRLGGWKNLFTRERGNGADALHLKIARIAWIGIVISSLTGVWMGLATLGWIPDPNPLASLPAQTSSAVPLPADQLSGLTSIAGDEIRSITLPREGMSGQAYEVETDAGSGFIDPATGEVLTWVDRSFWSEAMDIVHLLHTGQGASVLGFVLGIMSLSIPFLSVTGVLIWLRGSEASKGLPKTKAEQADVVILVGSEGGTTWRFAKAFANTLISGGKKVHVTAMNNVAPARYKNASSIVVFAATYGDGDAPESASEFLGKLEKTQVTPQTSLSILGFGDSSYPNFCAFADEVAKTAKAKGWEIILHPHKVDRQDLRAFSDFSMAYASAHGLTLEDPAVLLETQSTKSLRLVEKQLFGEDAQAPTAILRFALPKLSLTERLMKRGFANFQAGDLLNFVPEGADSPRSYSLASQTKDGFVEICVRKVHGGLASSQLCNLELGDTIEAYTTINANFHAPQTKSPLILIGAGAGIGALAGIIRANTAKNEAHLFFGMRSRGDGIPYKDDLTAWENKGFLSSLTLALSRSQKPRYVQNAMIEEADKLRDLIERGAHVMICGSREMGEGVSAAFDQILAPLQLNVSLLEKEGRYAVDVF